MTEKEFEQLPMMLRVSDVQNALGIGRNSAYELIYQKNFPVLKIGERKIRIPKDEFVKWIKQNSAFYSFDQVI